MWSNYLVSLLIHFLEVIRICNRHKNEEEVGNLLQVLSKKNKKLVFAVREKTKKRFWKMVDANFVCNLSVVFKRRFNPGNQFVFRTTKNKQTYKTANRGETLQYCSIDFQRHSQRIFLKKYHAEPKTAKC